MTFFIQNVGVHHGRADVFVAEEFLDGADSPSSFMWACRGSKTDNQQITNISKPAPPDLSRSFFGIPLASEGLAIWVPWPVLSGRGMDGHGQARTNTDW